MSITVREAVNDWKTRTLQNDDIVLEDACSAIGKDTQPFEAQKVNAVEWVLCRKGEKTPATFSYAAIFASSDPVETGNFVPDGEEMPVGMVSERAESFASYKCSYSYSFDTSGDNGLYLAQSDLDKYMERVPGFNSTSKPRRAWQSGNNASNMHRFWMRIPMFLRLRFKERKGPPPEHLHDWVKQADLRSRAYRANPARPNVLALDGKLVRRIEDCEPSYLVRGDAVAITFSVTYIEGKQDWYPNFTLIDIVRVASDLSTLAGITTADEDSVVLNNIRPALVDGQQIRGTLHVESDEDLEIVGEVAVDNTFVAGIIRTNSSNADPQQLVCDSVRTAPVTQPDIPSSQIVRQTPVLHSDICSPQDLHAGTPTAIQDLDGGSGRTLSESRTLASSQAVENVQYDDEKVSSSSSTASTVSTVSDDSGHWSDGAIEDGPSPISERAVSSSYSDDGHDSKRKKLVGGNSRRRTTRARR